MSTLAPVGISTYSRLSHLKQTIRALQHNTLAAQTELYIFSDAPQPGDEDIVRKMRSYLHTIDGFKAVYIIERTENSRVRNNRDGHKQLLEQYGKMIFLEDDIVTAPGFLAFMNEALETYQEDKRILSVTGYTPPMEIPQQYEQDAFILQRMSAWGFGIWKDRYDRLDYINQRDFEAERNSTAMSNYMKQAGQDVFFLFALESSGSIDGLDAKAMYLQYTDTLYTVYPRKSLVQNVGHDGSGLHSTDTDKFHVSLWDKEEFTLETDILVDATIVEANYRFRKLTSKQSCVLWMRRSWVFNVIQAVRGVKITTKTQ